MRWFALLAVLGLILAGCSGGGESGPTRSAATPVATPTAAPPPTATPSPTAAPSPTATQVADADLHRSARVDANRHSSADACRQRPAAPTPTATRTVRCSTIQAHRGHAALARREWTSRGTRVALGGIAREQQVHHYVLERSVFPHPRRRSIHPHRLHTRDRGVRRVVQRRQPGRLHDSARAGDRVSPGRHVRHPNRDTASGSPPPTPSRHVLRHRRGRARP